jgi:hypothetical protein
LLASFPASVIVHAADRVALAMVVCVSRCDGNRRESVRTALFGSKRSLEGIIVLGLEAAFQDSVFLHRCGVSVVRSGPCSVKSGRLSRSYLGPLPAGCWFGHHLVVLAFS